LTWTHLEFLWKTYHLSSTAITGAFRGCSAQQLCWFEHIIWEFQIAIEWTDERLQALTTPELTQLAANAREKGVHDLSVRCLALIDSRKPKQSIPKGLPDDFVRVSRTAVGKRLERDVVDLLVGTGNKLLKKYDLSTEKARALSIGIKSFMPHIFLDRNGSAKVGGAQKQGRVSFDRYISYRLRNEVYALVAILLDGDKETGVRYQVLGPRRLLTNFRPIREIRPYLLDEESIGVAEGGEEFSTYKDASERFEWIIEQVAPKL
jgi:hypothetical protein